MFYYDYLFFRFYANIPLDNRARCFMYLEGFGDVSWHQAYRQISDKTSEGAKILHVILLHKFLSTSV